MPPSERRNGPPSTTEELSRRNRDRGGNGNRRRSGGGRTRSRSNGPRSLGEALGRATPELAERGRRNRERIAEIFGQNIGRWFADAQRAAEERTAAERTISGMFPAGVDLPGPVLAPMPDRAAYIKPYQDASAQAHRVHAETVPVLNNIYNDLGTALASRQAEAGRQAERGRNEAAAEQQTLMAQASALTAPTGLAQQLGATEGAQAQADADRAFLNQRAADNAGLAREIAAMDQAHSETRRQDAEAMRSGSLSTARTNLDTLLQQIGLGQAEAERQYQADATETQLRNAQAQQEYATLKQQLEQEQLAMAQEREAMWADANERLAATATTSGRMNWEQSIQDRMQQYPAASAAMLDIIDAAGEGATGRANALRIIQDRWEELTRGRVTDPDSGDRMYGGKRLNPRVIRQWIDEYYDENEYVDPAAYAQLGGDPTYLPVRDRYAGG